MANITYIRIDDEVYALHDDNALTSDSSLDASKVVGTLPANTYTDTTYENKAAVQGGTDVSLVTTGDKYRWNNASSGGVSDVEVNGSSVVSGGIAEITVPTKTSDLTNDSNFQNATQVDTAINSRIASVYKAKGSVAFLDLPALTSLNEGFVYDINESFTTTSDFVEGAGVTYPAGMNVVIIDVGSGVYKYDVLAGLVDLSGKQDLLVSGTNIKTINSQSLLGSGNLTIGGGLQNLVDGSASGSVRGINTTAEDSSYTMGNYAFAEGIGTKASGLYSHAEGNGTKASSVAAHAEGHYTTASSNSSHAEGANTTASSPQAHAEGYRTTASGEASHAQNEYTIAAKDSQTTLGTYNIEDTSTTTTHPSKSTSYGQYAVIVGNGTNSQRSNALTIDWSGNTDQQGRATTKDLTSTQIDAIISELGMHGRTICPYDVGDIYITRNSTSPATKWEGTTWEKTERINDYIVEQGQSGIWNYKKYASGLVELWGVSSESSTPYGSAIDGYWYPHMRTLTFPFPIKHATGVYNVGTATWQIAGSTFPYSDDDTPDFISDSKIYGLVSASGTRTIVFKIKLTALWKDYVSPETIYEWRRLS